MSSTTQRRSQLQHGYCIGVSRRRAQATAGKGLGQGPYVAARAVVEPTTLRLKVIVSTKAPPRPTSTPPSTVRHKTRNGDRLFNSNSIFTKLTFFIFYNIFPRGTRAPGTLPLYPPLTCAHTYLSVVDTVLESNCRCGSAYIRFP